MSDSLIDGRHLSTTVARTWGNEEWLVTQPCYWLKLLNIRPEASIPWHYHPEKDEVIMIPWWGDPNLAVKVELGNFNPVTGQGERGSTIWLDKVGLRKIHIPAGVPHRILANPCEVGVTQLVEVSTQHREDDVVFLEHPYDSSSGGRDVTRLVKQEVA